MESQTMDVEPTRIPKRKERINALTGVFLRSVYVLDSDLSKCVIVGFVKNRGDSLGVLFKGKKGCVYWSHDVFNQITPHFNSITLALENKTKFYIKSDTEEDINCGKEHSQPLYLDYDSDIIPATPEPCSRVIVPTSRIPQQAHVPSEGIPSQLNFLVYNSERYSGAPLLFVRPLTVN
ncbi:hypothetical protein J6590_102473 [Homalodisca vitripennis]|nr:hypothetical protein J6590_102473 [Homalodisca vitripennis]